MVCCRGQEPRWRWRPTKRRPRVAQAPRCGPARGFFSRGTRSRRRDAGVPDQDTFSRRRGRGKYNISTRRVNGEAATAPVKKPEHASRPRSGGGGKNGRNSTTNEPAGRLVDYDRGGLPTKIKTIGAAPSRNNNSPTRDVVANAPVGDTPDALGRDAQSLVPWWGPESGTPG